MRRRPMLRQSAKYRWSPLCQGRGARLLGASAWREEQTEALEMSGFNIWVYGDAQWFWGIPVGLMVVVGNTFPIFVYCGLVVEIQPLNC